MLESHLLQELIARNLMPTVLVHIKISKNT